MKYSRYFKPQQKVLLKSLTDVHDPSYFEAITACFVRGEKDFFDLAIPYEVGSDDTAPFGPGTKFVLFSDAFGLGLQLTGQFAGFVDRRTIRVAPHDNLEAFTRREYLRADVTAGIHSVRGKWNLASCRQRWHGAIRAIGRDGGHAALQHLVLQQVNLSAGGIRLFLQAPVEVAELCLVVIAPGDPKPPVCALCEVAWTGDVAPTGMQPAGLRFVNILDEDRLRLDRQVRATLKQQGHDFPDSPERQDLLDRMHF